MVFLGTFQAGLEEGEFIPQCVVVVVVVVVGIGIVVTVSVTFRCCNGRTFEFVKFSLGRFVFPSKFGEFSLGRFVFFLE